MLFADLPTNLESAATWILIVVGLACQQLYQNWRADRAKAEVKKELEKQAGEVKHETRQVYEAVNGKGLMGMMQRHEDMLRTHFAEDDERFGDQKQRLINIERIVQGTSDDSRKG